MRELFLGGSKMPCYLMEGVLHHFRMLSHRIHEDLNPILKGEEVDYNRIEKCIEEYKEYDKKYKDKIKKYLELLEKVKISTANIAIAKKARQLNIVRYEEVEEWISNERYNLEIAEKELKVIDDELRKE